MIQFFTRYKYRQEFLNRYTEVALRFLKDFPYLPKWLILSMDTLISILSFITTLWICAILRETPLYLQSFLIKLGMNTACMLLFFLLFHTSKGIIRFSTFRDTLRILAAVSCATLSMALINVMLNIYVGGSIFPGIGFFINFVFTFFLLFFCRMAVRLIYDHVKSYSGAGKKNIPMMIYQVTPNNVSLGKMIKNTPNQPYNIIGFVTSDPKMADKQALNVPVFRQSSASFRNIMKKQHVRVMLINPEELSIEAKQNIVDNCLQHKIEILSAPPINEWKSGESLVKKIKRVKIEDLLSRPPIVLDNTGLRDSIQGKRVLITGAAGSIGSEIARQLSAYQPETLILCDNAETPIHQLRLELEGKFPALNLTVVVGDVKNVSSLTRVFKLYQPQLVYHVAAYKHVPLMEEHPCEAVMTNIFGTINVADLAVEHHCEAFVYVSTDKAVNPTNVMGASKRIAEIYVQSLDQQLEKAGRTQNKTRFITTRFGNVLGSNGSVIPRFKEQISCGGPITVTHPDIIRYFMTIPEACRLVLEAGNMGLGGEIFVFDMGDPVKIVDLAKRMILLSGLEVDKDIKIQFTGLRPGEKLYEELLNNGEDVQPTSHDKILIAGTRKYEHQEVQQKIQTLVGTAFHSEAMETVRLMKDIVPEFISENSEYCLLDKLTPAITPPVANTPVSTSHSS